MQTSSKQFVYSKPIALVGLPGCGKTTMGRALAKRMRLNFFDSDFEIEKNMEMTVADIFYFFNESYFRKKEYEMIAELLEDKRKCLIAVGGGAFANEKTTHQLLKEKAITIYLKVPIEELAKRMEEKDQRSERPLMKDGDIKKKYEDLLTKRQKFYEEADLILDCSEASHRSQVIKSLVNLLREHSGEEV